jgi:Protein of unknown function (DUF2806)
MGLEINALCIHVIEQFQIGVRGVGESGKLVDIKIDMSKLEGLSDSVKIFTKRMSDEVGAFTKPYHVKRLARAKADAAIIKAENESTLTEIQERGLRRMAMEEGRRQENIENIAMKAIEHIKEDARPEVVNGDWISNFFDKCRLVSDQDMQILWAKLLAAETNAPQSISKRTVATLATLDKNDAQMFTKFCSCVWVFGSLTPVVFDEQAEHFLSLGLNFNSLLHLESIGLINFNMTGFRRLRQPKYIVLSYYGRALSLELPDGTGEIPFGKVLLSETGTQLATICGSVPDSMHYEAVVQHFFNNGYSLSSLISNRGFF